MRIISITVRDKVAVNAARTRYVCGNSDYVIRFDFDEEWNVSEAKTARFVYGNSYQEQVFSGNECPVPIISDVGVFEVGVYAGNLRTSTPARVPADKSILCKNGMPVEPAQNVYAQLMEMIEEGRLQGPKGETGDTGPQGPQGDTGPVGATGERGEKGDKGDTGLQGPIGEQGPKGDTGERGAQGPVGPQGEKGETGPQGERGETGPAGPQGERGATGPAGPQGERGEQGPQGERGERGPKGDPGNLDLPEAGAAHMQLVTDQDGNITWEEKLAYSNVTMGSFVNLPETDMQGVADDDGDGVMDSYALLTPFEVYLEAGKTYQVTVNGATYDCMAVDASELTGGASIVVLGNLEAMGESGVGGSNPDAPFVLMAPTDEATVAMMQMYAFLLGAYGTETVTLSISYTGEIVSRKTIDPGYLPDSMKRTPITLTIGSDGNVTSDTPFNEAWAMDAGQLQSAIMVKEYSNYKGDTCTAVDNVSKGTGGIMGSMVGSFIHIRLRKPFLDTSDQGDIDTTRFIFWTSAGCSLSSDIVYGLPILQKGDTYRNAYLRYSGYGWTWVTNATAKEDLNDTFVVKATLNNDNTITNVSQYFTTTLNAMKGGKHVVLALTQADGTWTYRLPAVFAQDQANNKPRVVFQMRLFFDEKTEQLASVTYSESGMTYESKVVSGTTTA